VAFVHQSNVASESLTNKQINTGLPKHKLIQDMPIRWNSSYLMLERLLEQIDLLYEIISEFYINDGTSFNIEDKKYMQSIVNVLKFYYDATLQYS
jgi:zinc finger BED domain-containing protein 4